MSVHLDSSPSSLDSVSLRRICRSRSAAGNWTPVLPCRSRICGFAARRPTIACRVLRTGLTCRAHRGFVRSGRGPSVYPLRIGSDSSAAKLLTACGRSTYSVRRELDSRIGLVTDTRPTPALSQLVAGVDLLVSEATFGDDADQPRAVERKHMTFREAAELALSAGARRLVLTHFSPSVAQPEDYAANAHDVFPNTVVGRDHFSVTLRFPND